MLSGTFNHNVSYELARSIQVSLHGTAVDAKSLFNVSWQNSLSDAYRLPFHGLLYPLRQLYPLVASSLYFVDTCPSSSSMDKAFGCMVISLTAALIFNEFLWMQMMFLGHQFSNDPSQVSIAVADSQIPRA